MFTAMRRLVELSSLLALVSATFITLASAPTRAAELVMFEQAACPWCQMFNREIAPTYKKTDEGLRAPLRRINIDKPLPPDLAFIQVERLTPLFVLVDKGREIGRIRGYPGEESFWMQLSVLFEKLGTAGTGGERTQVLEKTMRNGG
jgi:thioredoxin-related protein